MSFSLTRERQNDNVEKSYLLLRDGSIDREVYEKKYAKLLLNFSFKELSPCFLLYIEKFPSLISKIRSYKGLLNIDKSANFELKISSNESYLGILLELNESNKYTVLDYFFTPNNCCLIKMNNYSLVEVLKEKVFDFNFYSDINSFWINYDKLLGILETDSVLAHFYVNPNNEEELGVKTYSK